MSFSRQTPSAAATDAQAMLKAHVALYRALGGEGARAFEPPARPSRPAPQGGAAAVRELRAKLAAGMLRRPRSGEDETGAAEVVRFRPRARKEAAVLGGPPDITA